MKTRENELHEPIVEVKGNKEEHTNTFIAKCSVCRKELKRVWNGIHASEEKQKELLLNSLWKSGITYCPYCGARLKEVE